ncbi:MAG: alpha/beta hydrolase [Chloroflexi bacterium]|nr:alpha/beta hydrolase [Chloroflexota bacterium]
MDTSPHKSDFVNVNGIHLHYLDWGGNGPVLLFLTGMGCSAYIFGKFAPRFTDKFHVLALDRRGHGDSDYPETGYDPDTLTEDLRQFLDALKIDQVILAGHSMAYIELSHFAILYPERVLKLVFLDAAYDSSSSETKAVFERNPLTKMMPAWPEDFSSTIEEYIATIKRLFPALAVVWSEAMDEQTRHIFKETPDGKVVDKMSDAISKAINDTFASYAPEYSKIQAPVLSFFAIRDGSDYLSSDYMTEEQKAQVKDFFKTVLQPHNKRYIEQFQRKVPHARIVKIPSGHHYCFIKQEEVVFDEMRKFLLE